MPNKEGLIRFFDYAYNIEGDQRINEIISRGYLEEDTVNTIFNSENLTDGDFEYIYKFINDNGITEQGDVFDTTDIDSLFLSNAVYNENMDFIINKVKRHGFDNVEVINSENTSALMATKEGKSYIVFKGTESVGDWVKVNMKFWQTAFEDTVAHTGFAGEINDFSPKIKDYIERMEEKTNGKIVFGGHSMGGAIATLAAMKFKPEKLITFASPKVARGMAYKEYFEEIDVKRYANDNDLVRHVPFDFGRWTYRHIGETKILDTETNPLKFASNHKLSMYFKTVLENSMLGNSFTAYFLSNLYSIENYDIIEGNDKEHTKKIEDEIKKVSAEKGLTEDQAIEFLFRDKYRLNDREFSNYKKLLTENGNHFSNMSLKIMESFTDKKMSGVIKNYYNHVGAYKGGKGFITKGRKEDTKFEKMLYLIGTVGQLVTRFVITMDPSLLKTAFNAYKNNKERHAINDLTIAHNDKKYSDDSIGVFPSKKSEKGESLEVKSIISDAKEKVRSRERFKNGNITMK